MRSRRALAPSDSESPSALGPEAFHGVAGDIVLAIQPNTEADPAALLVQLLATVGFIGGRCAFCMADGARHYPNLFVLVAGETSKSRKGTSWSRVRGIFELLPAWPQDRVTDGLSSGEGLIAAVSGAEADKRLLVLESEFGSVLQVLMRRGNKLSAVMRNAWDATDLHTMTKTGALSASGQHITVIGHITRDELLTRIGDAELWNGFANRFLFVAAQRAQLLPHGGSTDRAALQPLLDRLADALKWMKTLNGRRIPWSEAASKEWERVYASLSAASPGLLGSVISRAEAQVLRLALIYALLDKSEVIRIDHLRAAVAAWDYCEASAQWIFGGTLGDPLADEILRLLRLNPVTGVTRTIISEHFQHHRTKAEIDRALLLLEQQDLARRETERTPGRPVERWFETAETYEDGEESEERTPRYRKANLLEFSDSDDLEFDYMLPNG